MVNSRNHNKDQTITKETENQNHIPNHYQNQIQIQVIQATYKNKNKTKGKADINLQHLINYHGMKQSQPELISVHLV